MKIQLPLGALNDVDVRLLKLFKTVADCGGLVAASLALNVDVSSVSRALRELEMRLGVVLCRRGRGGFELSAEGKFVYEETLLVLDSLQAFSTRINEMNAINKGCLNLAIFEKTATNPEAKIAQAIALFHKKNPEVSLNLHVASITTIENGVLSRAFDLGILPIHRASESLNYQALFSEKMFLYCGQAHPLFGKDDTTLDWTTLNRYHFAGLGFHSPNMEVCERYQMQRTVTGSDQESIVTLILSGQYLGFLPDHYAKIFEAEHKIRALRPALLHYMAEFVEVTPHTPKPSKALLSFQDCLRQAHGITAKAN